MAIHVSILVPDSAVMEGIGDPLYMFNTVNHFLTSAGAPPMFNVQLLGLKKEVKLLDGLITVHPQQLLHEVNHTDLIIVPPIHGDLAEVVAQNEGFNAWIVRQYERGTEVASLCTGAFLLAATGLLNERKCSTHWLWANDFRLLYPEVDLVDGKIITEDERIYSSGGANCYWNLLLYLVEKHTSHEIAILAANFFAIDIDRDSQSCFMMFNGQKNHNDDAIKKAQDYIEVNYQDRITVECLADKFAVGKRSFERRFKKATNNTVLEYIQRLKMEAAKRSFESSRKNISEVMYEVGYTDSKAFREVFKRVTGLTPIEYRNKYNKRLYALSTQLE